MSKKISCLAVGAMLFALCVSAEAQQPGKVTRLGWLASASPTPALASTRLSTGFRFSFSNYPGRYARIKEAVEPNRVKGVCFLVKTR